MVGYSYSHHPPPIFHLCDEQRGVGGPAGCIGNPPHALDPSPLGAPGRLNAVVSDFVRAAAGTKSTASEKCRAALVAQPESTG